METDNKEKFILAMLMDGSIVVGILKDEKICDPFRLHIANGTEGPQIPVGAMMLMPFSPTHEISMEKKAALKFFEDTVNKEQLDKLESVYTKMVEQMHSKVKLADPMSANKILNLHDKIKH